MAKPWTNRKDEPQALVMTKADGPVRQMLRFSDAGTTRSVEMVPYPLECGR
jgi:hypothetical protein